MQVVADLREVCYVIETMGVDSRNSFVAWFADLQLSDYNKAFVYGSKVHIWVGKGVLNYN